MEKEDRIRAHLAGRIIKVFRLSALPGMDKVAIKLNSGLTYKEETEAEAWSIALRVAKEALNKGETDIFELAAEFREEIRR